MLNVISLECTRSAHLDKLRLPYTQVVARQEARPIRLSPWKCVRWYSFLKGGVGRRKLHQSVSINFISFARRASKPNFPKSEFTFPKEAAAAAATVTDISLM